MDITFSQLKELLRTDRSVRRYDASRRIDHDILTQLVSLTRYCASGRNAQPLRYRIVDDAQKCEDMFATLAWAGYYKDWAGPGPTERPVAYLVQCLDTTYGDNCLCDDGLQLQAITLGASTMGIGGCIIKAFNAPALSHILSLPDRYMPRYVLALGYPAEKVKIVEMSTDDDFKYYRDSDDTQCVPKRPLSELLI